MSAEASVLKAKSVCGGGAGAVPPFVPGGEVGLALATLSFVEGSAAEVPLVVGNVTSFTALVKTNHTPVSTRKS